MFLKRKFGTTAVRGGWLALLMLVGAAGVAVAAGADEPGAPPAAQVSQDERHGWRRMAMAHWPSQPGWTRAEMAHHIKTATTSPQSHKMTDAASMHRTAKRSSPCP